MDLRSDYIIGKDIFVKLIKIESGLKDAIKNQNYLPFETNEMVMNYLLSSSKNYKDLITPKTKVLVSSDSYSISDINKDLNYDQSLKFFYNKGFIDFEKYLSTQKEIKTGIIISQKVTGNLDYFLRHSNDKKEIEDAFIHLCYLYFRYQKKMKAIHGDPKVANYTWLKLDTPIDMIYDFRNEFNPSLVIRRNNVKNIFYLTDLEFAYSPIVKTKKINNQTFYFNFSQKYEWLDDNRKNLIYVPKISAEPYYDYNINLYGGYEQKVLKEKGNIKEIFGLFPRLFTIDILTLIKMILTWEYTEKVSSLLRKFNIYFTQFIALSKKEERYEVDYSKVSPASFAEFLSS
jgi:hypothetical protein